MHFVVVAQVKLQISADSTVTQTIQLDAGSPYISFHTQVCMCACVCVCVRACVCACVHVLCMYVCVCVYVCVRSHVYVCAYVQRERERQPQSSLFYTNIHCKQAVLTVCTLDALQVEWQ